MHNRARRVILTALAVAAILVPASAILVLRVWQGEYLPTAETKLRFRETSLNFTSVVDLERSLPFMAAAAVDIDGDGRDELFLGGGRNEPDGIFSFRDDGFVESPRSAALAKAIPSATHGVAAVDLDDDGRDDLLIAREDGVWLYLSGGEGEGARRLDLPLPANTTPLSIALADVNQDGHADFFISGYIRADLVEGETIFRRPYGGYSSLFINHGDNTWRDETELWGVLRQHNTFTALFADLDNDFDSDLVIAQDTGRVEMYENRGAPPFVPISNPSVNGYPMGIAAGDIDNDGLIDLFFSNVGHTLPAQMLRGDLGPDAPLNTDYMLFHNGGRLSFVDVAETAGVARLGFGWGAVAADMDLDGRADLMAAQNYIRLPLNWLMTRYPGKLLLQQPDGAFASAEEVSGVANPAFGSTPIIADFNGDGRPDIVWANIGGPARAFLSTEGAGNAIRIRLPNTARTLNAKVEIVSGNLRQMFQVIANQGLGSDQSRTIIVGLGVREMVDEVSITLQDGAVLKYRDVPMGAFLRPGLQ